MIELFKLVGTIAIDNSKANRSIDETTQRAEGSSSKIGGAFKKMAGVLAAAFATAKIVSFGKECINAWNIQKEAEVKLETIMKQRMKATDDSIQSIKDYASHLQQIGVVGDEVQLAGAQQLATFLKSDKALKNLMPAMANLVVQQKGLNASSGDFVNIGNLMGKVMMGQTAALKRVGITFDAHQEKLLKTGTEQQRAAVLAQVITDNVGEMNKAMRKTDAGKIQAAKNDFGDLQEEIGKRLTPVLGRLADKASQMISWVSKTLLPKLDQLSKFLKTHKSQIKLFISAISGLIVVFAGMKIILVVIGMLKTLFTTLTMIKSVSGVFALLKFGIMALGGPVTVIIGAIGALAGVFIYLWNTNKDFRNAIINIWNNIKNAVVSIFTSIAEFLKGIWNGILNAVTTAWNAVYGFISSVLGRIYEAFNFWLAIVVIIVTTIWNGLVGIIRVPLNAILNIIRMVFTTISSLARTTWNGLVTIIKAPLNTIKAFMSAVWNGIKMTLVSIWSGIKSAASIAFNGIKAVINTIWGGVKAIIVNPIKNAFNIVKGVIDRIKGLFSFKISFPKIPLPHFGIKPKGWGVGDLLKGKIPKLNIDWYAKAMDDGMIMNRPTAFGINKNGQVMAGGEAGSETIVGTQSLMKMITTAVLSTNNGLESRVDRLIIILETLLKIMMSGQTIKLNDREFARLVREVF